MRATLSLFRREFAAYFLSPIAYVVLTVLLLVTGYLFANVLGLLTGSGPQGIEFPMRRLLGLTEFQTFRDALLFMAFWTIYLIIPALLTMRLLAEEQNSGTLELLLTAPIKDWQIVLAKFSACFMFYLVLWLPTLVYLPVLADLEGLPVEAVVAGLPQWLVVGLIVVAVYFLLSLGGFLTALGQSHPVFWLLIPLVAAAWFWLSLGPVAAGTSWVKTAIHIAGGVWVLGALLQLVFRLQLAQTALHFVIGLGLFLAAALSVFCVSGIDPWPVISTYLGLALAGAMFLALGMFVSSLVKSQMVAALITLFISLAFVVPGIIFQEGDPGSMVNRVLFFFTVPLHFDRNFCRGMVDTRQLVLYLSVTWFLLFLTVRSLESRRWR